MGELEAALTEERQRTRLSETVIRENEALTKENMELVASRDEWRRGKCPRWPEDWIYKDYCQRCPERAGCKDK